MKAFIYKMTLSGDKTSLKNLLRLIKQYTNVFYYYNLIIVF